MIVVDTNVIAYLYLSGQYSDQVEQVLRRDAEWAAPLLWRSELRSVLALTVRRKQLSLGKAQRIMGEAMHLMQDLEYTVNSERVLGLTTTSNCSAYDCEFIALAAELSVPLVTMDKQILAEFAAVALSMTDFLATTPPT